MSSISIVDLEVYYCVGVPEPERAKPQRLLLSLEMEFDFSSAARSDAIEQTIDYDAVTRDLLNFGQGRAWRLIETLASEIAEHVLGHYRPKAVRVEVKKFVIPQARYVAVSLRRGAGTPSP